MRRRKKVGGVGPKKSGEPRIPDPVADPGTPPPPSENRTMMDESLLPHLLALMPDVPEIRQGKVDAVRRSLAEGTYDIDGKLDAALDRILDEL